MHDMEFDRHLRSYSVFRLIEVADMRKWLVILMTLLTVGAQAQRQQISYIEETYNPQAISQRRILR